VAEAGIGSDYEQMPHVAAVALNEAKATGRNRFVIRSFRKPSDAALTPFAYLVSHSSSSIKAASARVVTSDSLPSVLMIRVNASVSGPTASHSRAVAR